MNSSVQRNDGRYLKVRQHRKKTSEDLPDYVINMKECSNAEKKGWMKQNGYDKTRKWMSRKAYDKKMKRMNRKGYLKMRIIQKRGGRTRQ